MGARERRPRRPRPSRKVTGISGELAAPAARALVCSVPTPRRAWAASAVSPAPSRSPGRPDSPLRRARLQFPARHNEHEYSKRKRVFQKNGKSWWPRTRHPLSPVPTWALFRSPLPPEPSPWAPPHGYSLWVRGAPPAQPRSCAPGKTAAGRPETSQRLPEAPQASVGGRAALGCPLLGSGPATAGCAGRPCGRSQRLCSCGRGQTPVSPSLKQPQPVRQQGGFCGRKKEKKAEASQDQNIKRIQ